jgi:hypothetical protein
MVSAAYQEGNPFAPVRVASDGEQAILTSFGSVAGVSGEGEAIGASAVYMDTRGAMGWQLVPLNASLSEFVGQVPIAYEAESGTTLWIQHTPQQAAPTRGLYIRSGEGLYSFVGPLSPSPESEEESDVIETQNKRGDYQPIAATSSFGHIVLRLEKPGTEFGLYEYSGTENRQPTQVNVTGTEKGSTSLLGNCATLGGNYKGGGSEYNALSSNGEAVFFTAPCEGPQTEIYARWHGSLTDAAPAETVDVSKSECSATCGEVSGKNFEGASESGEKVFFTSTQRLTLGAVDKTANGDATERTGCSAAGSTGCNLYEYDFGEPSGKRLRVVGSGGDVLGVSAISSDGSRVYFVSTNRLTEEARGGGSGPCLTELRREVSEGRLSEVTLLEEEAKRDGRCWAKAEGDNLYVYDSVNDSIEFVATLNGGDGKDWLRQFRRPVEVAGEAGRFLLLASVESGLTLDDRNLNGIEELFEYDAVTGELVRITKGEEGYDENGNGAAVGVQAESISTLADREGYSTVFRSPANLLNISRDGRTVVFQTVGALSPRAVSALEGCTSVYEFRSEGPISQGTVHLISDGQDVQPLNLEQCGAEFRDMDATGKNILFSTADPLLSSDVDGVERSIYDAREGGGFPPESAGAAVGSCGGACGRAVGGEPSWLVPGSMSEPAEGPVPIAVPPAVEGVAHKKRISTGEAHKLAKALRLCRAGARKRRVGCERTARRRFGSKKASKAERGGE